MESPQHAFSAALHALVTDEGERELALNDPHAFEEKYQLTEEQMRVLGPDGVGYHCGWLEGRMEVYCCCCCIPHR